MKEAVEEELTAIQAIFCDSYKKMSDNSFTVRIDLDVEQGDAYAPPTFFLQVIWMFQLSPGYPDVIP